MKVDWRIIQCFKKGFSLSSLKDAVLVNRPREGEFALEQQIEEAKRTWKVALEQMCWADKDMLDAAILHATACERRYIALLQMARNQGYTAWEPSETVPVVANHSS